MTVKSRVRTLAGVLWGYHRLGQGLRHSELILVLGSHDISVAEYTSRLFLQEWAPRLMFSGGRAHFDDLLATSWSRPEAEVFRDVALGFGVPSECIVLETESTNTGETVLFSKEVLKDEFDSIDIVMVVHKPYMERRAFATGRKHWPGKELILTSSGVSFDEYTRQRFSAETVINIMVGDLQRIKVYGERGFQIEQDIPENVWLAYQELVALGFDKHLLST